MLVVNEIHICKPSFPVKDFAEEVEMRQAIRGFVEFALAGAPSFRVLCERVGSPDPNLSGQTQKKCRSVVPTLAKNARMGHPLSW